MSGSFTRGGRDRGVAYAVFAVVGLSLLWQIPRVLWAFRRLFSNAVFGVFSPARFYRMYEPLVSEFEAELTLSDPPRLTPSGETDDALQNQLMSIAKQVTRAAKKSRADGLPVWPRRVLRWKGPGRGG